MAQNQRTGRTPTRLRVAAVRQRSPLARNRSAQVSRIMSLLRPYAVANGFNGIKVDLECARFGIRRQGDLSPVGHRSGRSRNSLRSIRFQPGVWKIESSHRGHSPFYSGLRGPVSPGRQGMTAARRHRPGRFCRRTSPVATGERPDGSSRDTAANRGRIRFLRGGDPLG